MNKASRFFIGYWLFLVLVGCASVRPTFQQQILKVDSVYALQRDTVIFIQPDSAMVQALFRCDSLNRVVLDSLSIRPAKAAKPAVRFRDRILTVVVPVDSMQIYLQYKSLYEYKKRSEKTTKKIITKPKPVKKTAWYVKVLAGIGLLSLLVLLSFFVLKSVKK